MSPLPPRLTERLIQLETAFSEEPKLSTLNELVALYSVTVRQAAIEHYEALQNPLYKQYQERLRATLHQRDVYLLLNHSAPSTPRSSTDDSEVMVFRPKERPRRLGPGVTSLTFRDKREIDTMLTSTQSESNLTVKKIQSDLQAQNCGVSSRLYLRRLKMSSPRGISIQKSFEFPPPPPSPPLDALNQAYEQELEKLLETYIRRQGERRAGIRKQYDDQIQELAGGQQSTVIMKVIAQLQVAMEMDIAVADGEVEKEKRAEIIRLQQRFRREAY